MNKKNEMLDYVFTGISPLLVRISKSRIVVKSGLHADYSSNIAEFEAFSRLLYGVIPLIKNNDARVLDFISLINDSILNGCDCESDSYWGSFKSPDQRTVECIPIALYLYYCKSSSWDKFSDKEKGIVNDWLLQVNSGNIYDSNWLFFRLIINLVFKKLGYSYDSQAIIDSENRISKLFLGEGIYQDGKQKRFDYYNSFAFHYYGLIAASLDPESEYSEKLILRAEEFGKIMLMLQSSRGDVIPFGRSLTYKMATSAFWSALALNGKSSYSYGFLKGIILRIFDFWKDKDIYDESGILTNGYTYSNPFMTENYNAYGSPYWAYKFFLVLLCDDSFWNAEITEFTANTRISYIKTIGSIFTSSSDGTNLMFFPNIDTGSNDIILNFAHKYLKFVYSNFHGFCIPRSNDGFERGGYDNSLVASDDNNIFFTREELRDVKSNGKWLYSYYRLQRGVSIRSYIVPNENWHVRIHLVKTDHPIYVKDCGFSVPKRGAFVNKNQEMITISYNGNYSGIYNYSLGSNNIIDNCAMTNILYSETIMPFYQQHLKRGMHLIVNLFFSSNSGVPSLPNITIGNKKVFIFFNNAKTTIDLSGFFPSTSYYRHMCIKLARKIKKKTKSILLGKTKGGK